MKTLGALKAWSVVGLLLLAAGTASAQEPPPPAYQEAPPPGYGEPPPPPPPPPPQQTYAPQAQPGLMLGMPPGAEEHDGFFFRVAIGLGYQAGAFSDVDLTIGGFAGLLDLAIGGAIAPNLILHADIFGASTPDPVVTNGDASSVEFGLFTSTGLGLGITYYMMPLNLYISSAVGFGVARLEDDFGFVEGETEIGLGWNGMIGKEWWVTDQWGIGVAGQVQYFRLPDLGTLNIISGGILFSATYN